MPSTLTGTDADPDDLFVIEPQLVVVARTERGAPHAAPEIQSGFEIIDVKPKAEIIDTASVDTTFRAAAVNDMISDSHPRTTAFARHSVLALLAACGAIGAAAWQHYGDRARNMIADLISPSAIALSQPAPSSSPAQRPVEAAQLGAPPVRTETQSTNTDRAAGPTPSPALTAEAVAAEAAQLPSVGRDIATMRQEIDQLKATIEQLKASQGQLSRDANRSPLAKTSTPSIPDGRLRPKPASPQPSAGLPPRRPTPAYAPTPSTAASTFPAAPPFPQGAQSPAQAQAYAPSDGGPVVRPPMPLH